MDPSFPAEAGGSAAAPLSRRALLRFAGAATLLGAAAGCSRVAEREDGRTVLRYMAWGNPEQLQLEEQICREFEKKNPAVRVHLFMVPGSSYPDKLQLMLASRTAPDVMRVDHYIFPALVRKDYFLPLDSFVAAEPKGFLDDFVKPALDECWWNGKLYALNVLFGAVMIYYNRALVAAANLPDPYRLAREGKWDWDAFVNAATALTKRDSSGRTTQFGTSMAGFPLYSAVVWNRGGEFMNQDMTRFVLADDPRAVQGIQDYADLRWKWKCAPTPADNALSAFTFESGKIAMNWGWAGDTPRYRKNIKDFDWDLAPTPSGPAGDYSVVKGNQLVASRDTLHPELAWEFIKFMTSPETELLVCGKLRRAVPTRLSVQNDPRYLQADAAPHQTDVFLDSVRKGRTLPIDWRYQEWSQEYNAATDVLFNVGGETAAQACRDATDRINALLAGEEGF